ncbi:hypothetical protein ACQCSX_22575 (plasmid) [Pseudarthrobacter sp. P1]|uniref:hypothetical protein n=1 Tax=Pseudarthrobacter sp. P1 TaxID=3418418 RepID=UPI003CF34F4B
MVAVSWVFTAVALLVTRGWFGLIFLAILDDAAPREFCAKGYILSPAKTPVGCAPTLCCG